MRRRAPRSRQQPDPARRLLEKTCIQSLAEVLASSPRLPGPAAMPSRARRPGGRGRMRKDAELRAAYEAGAGVRDLAAAHGLTDAAVRSALKRAGTTVRRGGGRRVITDAEGLRELYVERGWTVERIAQHYRCNRQAVDHALSRFGIPKRTRHARTTGPAPRGSELRREYEAGATMPELAAAHDMSYTAVRSSLQRAGTTLRLPGWPRGRARGNRSGGRPHVIDDAAELRKLYVERGLSSTQVAAHYGCSVKAVRSALHRFAIPARTRHDVFTEERAEELRELYARRRWSIERIATHYGCGIAAVRSGLHRFGIFGPHNDPVLGARLRSDYEAGATLDELAAAHGLSRATVTTALRHAGATIRNRGGIKRWGRSRAELQTWDAQLRKEYLHGASIRQLAASHGRSHNAIRKALARADTPMRAASRPHSTPRTPNRQGAEPPEATQGQLTADAAGSGR